MKHAYSHLSACLRHPFSVLRCHGRRARRHLLLALLHDVNCRRGFKHAFSNCATASMDLHQGIVYLEILKLCRDPFLGFLG